MFLRIALLPLVFGLTVPAVLNAKPINSLVIHSDDTRENCNDGFYWDSTEKSCMVDDSR